MCQVSLLMLKLMLTVIFTLISTMMLMLMFMSHQLLQLFFPRGTESRELLVDEQFSFGLVRVSKNKKGTSIYYRCICTKSTKCEAVAIVKAREVVEEEVEEDQKF